MITIILFLAAVFVPPVLSNRGIGPRKVWGCCIVGSLLMTLFQFLT